MVPEMEKPRVTEIKVRMDCNGCVQKIKKALHGITGIYDIYVDFSEQKIAITGWAEPEKLVKAIKKTRKSAVICVHTEQSDEAGQPPPPEGETTPEEGAPPPEMPPEPSNQRAEPTEAAPPGEEPPESENPPPAVRQHHQPPRQEGHEGVHIVYQHPPDHGYQYHPNGPNLQQGYSGQWNAYHGGPGFRGELYHPPQPVYVQSYNTYRPSPHVTEYAYPRSPPRYSFNNRPDHYSGPGFRGEPPQPPPQPPQPPQPVYATHSYNTHKPSTYVTGYAYPQSPPKHSPYNRPDNYSGPGFRGEPSQPPQPQYATHNYNMYKPSPYVTEYAYPESPPKYSPYSIPDNYSRDYHSGNYENGNVTSMFSEENPNACRIV
ncbi:hypothetical protein C2S52_014440 [Perilla frutescens var. hirtella]|uniref:HMA domain-containing protein n=1 Tax=Perilla frutescens var. hirtella TaxID=608512 RepID=A0AAD4P9N2_PERFH|nr:hypothetical protein C2S52_014440 [Perilla frutescens var. hirtella]KAH6831878.1 hypothetical protein C2S53_012753 [Perilla frutescens var. hirtella]